MADRDFDIVIYGATGFTGRLVAEYLVGRAPGLRWAMAGRSRAKLEQIRADVAAPAGIPLLTADAADAAALRALASRTRLVINTVGPYQIHGEPLLAACADAGTAYVDLCGEPAWMRRMIDKYDVAAKANGARIVFSCGFDSIPFDLGVWMLQQEAKRRFGVPASRVKGRVRGSKGSLSGGTVASARATMAAAAKDPTILRYMMDPFALTPGFTGPSQPNAMVPYHDDAVAAWVAPFMMAVINTKNVHRTNFLSGHAYGADFRYDEMVVVPGEGEAAKAAAEALAKRNPMQADTGPAPGEGPSREERESGFYDLLFLADMPDGERLRVAVQGDRDPGYGSTSRMIVEAALCLLDDIAGEGGIWTAGALMPEPLKKRLETYAGLRFTLE